MKTGCSFLFVVFCLLSLLLFPPGAIADDIKRSKKVNIGPYESCYKIKNVKLEENGLITLRFNHHKTKLYCPGNILYDVTTAPAGLIRGAKGVNGRNPNNPFFIQVSPNAKTVRLKVLRGGNVAFEQFNFGSPISQIKTLIEAENSIPSWQKAFKNTESKLIAKAATDKIPPIITILSPDVTPTRKVFKVDIYQTFVRGRISDNEGVANLLINGSNAGVKADGSFAKKVKLAFGSNQIQIQAEDINGNVAERTFTIIREEFIPDEVIADVDIPKKTKMNNPDGIGVVIGVESYQYVSPATYAYNDAEVFREYLSDTLGYKKSKIKLATNSKATQAELNKLLGPNGWIARNVKAGKSDVVVYFSGHGIPDAKTKKTGLLPFDVDPNYSIGITLKDLYKTLGNLNARSVTVFLDTCFSGQGREKQTLMADTRGIQIVPKEREVPNNVTVLSAATAGQVSGPIKAKEHGLFSYYVLKGMGGDADSNKDNQLTMSELGKYVHSKVKEDASITGREQTPELQGDGERVLVKW